MSMDKSVIVGSYDVFNLGLPDPDPEVVSYSYIFKDQKAGIDSVTLPDEGNYKVYNLQGVNVLNTKDASRINDLPSGIYVINGKKYQIKH